MTEPDIFKKHVENLCRIVDWKPTLSQLAEIARRFAVITPKSASDAHAIVQAVCPGSRYFVTDGVDNSDLRALLALAIAAAKS